MFKKVIKIALATLTLAILGGCYTMKPGEDFPIQGKVWRGDVTRTYAAVPFSKLADAHGDGAPGFIKERDSLRRFTMVRIFGEGYFKDLIIGRALIPDSLEYSDLETGSIVDILFQKGTEIDFNADKLTRIVKLVCKGSDKECRKTEFNAHRVFTIIDPNAPSDYMGGNTYKRLITPEERKKYE